MGTCHGFNGTYYFFKVNLGQPVAALIFLLYLLLWCVHLLRQAKFLKIIRNIIPCLP